MLRVEYKQDKKVVPAERFKIEDIIVNRVEDVVTIEINGTQIREIKERKIKKVNLTKVINETKKLVIQDNAKELLAKIDEIKEAVNKGV